MTATYTFDVFSSLDGFGAAGGNWTGYWGKQGPELLGHRLALYDQEQRMVFGANTYRAFAGMLAPTTAESEARDPWVTRMRSLPATVASTTLPTGEIGERAARRAPGPCRAPRSGHAPNPLRQADQALTDRERPSVARRDAARQSHPAGRPIGKAPAGLRAI